MAIVKGIFSVLFIGLGMIVMSAGVSVIAFTAVTHLVPARSLPASSKVSTCTFYRTDGMYLLCEPLVVKSTLDNGHQLQGGQLFGHQNELRADYWVNNAE